MNHTPRQITIIGNGQNYFTIVAQDWSGECNVADQLNYDEMLGTIARICCPVHDNGEPWRRIGPVLFLKPPNKS